VTHTTTNALGCNDMSLTLVGSTNLTFDLDLKKDTPTLWSADQVATVAAWTDGYQLVSEQKMIADGTANAESGTCFGLNHPQNFGAFCHTVLSTSTATTIAAGGHKVRWLAAGWWQSNTQYTPAFGLLCEIDNCGLTLYPEATSEVLLGAAADAKFTASIFLPTEAINYSLYPRF